MTWEIEQSNNCAIALIVVIIMVAVSFFRLAGRNFSVVIVDYLCTVQCRVVIWRLIWQEFTHAVTLAASLLMRVIVVEPWSESLLIILRRMAINGRRPRRAAVRFASTWRGSVANCIRSNDAMRSLLTRISSGNDPLLELDESGDASFGRLQRPRSTTLNVTIKLNLIEWY